jgi:tetratricopeptide (TPR) repeat protein
MQELLQSVRDLQKQATSARKKGDAYMARRGDEAHQAYREGLVALTEALRKLDPMRKQLVTMEPPLAADEQTVLNELVETFGSLGGLQQRLGLLKEAYENYSAGGRLEEQFKLPTTYNRLNAVRCALLTGQYTLRDLEPRITELAVLLEASLRNNQELSDSGWAWADLGDCMALLGRLDDARRAYSTFIAKAEIKSPERTLDLLRNIAFRLEDAADPDAPRLQAAVAVLQSGLTTR